MVVVMVSAELHFRVEREMVSVLLQRRHMVTERVVRTISLRQDVCEQTVAHADTEEPFDISFGWSGLFSSETLQCRQEKYAASGFQNIATLHNVRPLHVLQ